MFSYTRSSRMKADPSERYPVVNAPNTWQEIYGRARVRELVLAYHRSESPRRIRQLLDDSTPWDQGSPSLPTPPVIWTALPRAGAMERRQNPPDEGGGSPVVVPPIPPGGQPSRPGAGIQPAPEPPAPVTPLTEPEHQQTQAVIARNESRGFDWAGTNLSRVLSDLADRAIAPPKTPSGWIARCRRCGQRCFHTTFRLAWSGTA